MMDLEKGLCTEHTDFETIEEITTKIFQIHGNRFGSLAFHKPTLLVSFSCELEIEKKNLEA
jgi:hypothetical protein